MLNVQHMYIDQDAQIQDERFSSVVRQHTPTLAPMVESSAHTCGCTQLISMIHYLKPDQRLCSMQVCIYATMQNPKL